VQRNALARFTSGGSQLTTRELRDVLAAFDNQVGNLNRNDPTTTQHANLGRTSTATLRRSCGSFGIPLLARHRPQGFAME